MCVHWTVVDRKATAAPDEGAFRQLTEWIESGDVRFTNFGATIRDERPGWPTKDPGQGHIGDPDVLDEVTDIGFNLLSLANNHAWDAGIDGVLDTVDHLDGNSIPHAGTGRDRQGSREPARCESTQSANVVPGARLRLRRGENDSRRVRRRNE